MSFLTVVFPPSGMNDTAYWRQPPSTAFAGNAIVCAVPFLRSRDLCGAMEGASPDERREAEIEAQIRARQNR